MVRSTKRSLLAKDENSKPAKLQRTSSTGTAKQTDDNMFCKLVTVSGVNLGVNDENNELEKDQVLFQSTFTKEYKKVSTNKEIKTDFVKGFIKYIQDPKRFKMCLLPTITSESCSVSYRGEQQESIIRILLGIPFIQAAIGRSLLDKLYHDSANDNEVFKSIFHGLDVPCLVVSQFRWLDKIADSKALTDKMFEIISKSNPTIQKELISCIPDLVEDSRHREISLQLKMLLEKNISLSSCILEAIGNLNLKGETLKTMQSSVLRLLESAEPNDLSTLIKFILQSVTELDACQVLTDLRDCLACYDFQPVSCSTPAASNARKGIIGDDSFDVIKSALLFNSAVANGWMKSIEKMKDNCFMKTLDLFVLFTLHSKTTTAKPALTIFRAKIKSHCLCEDVIHTALINHTKVFNELRSTILSVCETLLRSPEQLITSFGAALYAGMFTEMDEECQQAVIATLISHITSGVSIEIEAAFNVLTDLVELQPKKMILLVSQLKGLLDCIDMLNMQQIRSLFTMLGMLGSLDTSDSTMEDLLVYLRNQLSSNQQKSKRMGIIGLSIVIGCSARKRSSSEMTSSKDSMLSQTLDLLKKLQKGVERQSDSAALFYDELSQIIDNETVNTAVLEWINETMMAHFQEKFTIGCETIQKSDSSQVDLCFNIDETTDEAIAINIAPMLLKELETTATSSSSRLIASHQLASLAPQFRLVQTCEKKQSGDLSGICALLGCPVALFNENTFELFSKSPKNIKDTICLSLVYTIGWLQELVNAFASSSDKEIQSKVLKRLSNIQLLSRQLAQCLITHTAFQMPQFQFDIIANKCTSPKLVSDKKKIVNKGKKRKKQPNKDMEVTCIDAEKTTCEEDDEEDIADETPNEKQIAQSMTSLRKCLRELDITVFDVFNYRSVVKAVRDVSLFNEDSTASVMVLPTIVYLIEDLCSKLKFKLPSTSSGRKTFFKAKSDKSIGFSHLSSKTSKDFVTRVVRYLPSLFLILKTAITKFQSIINQNDGIMDGKGMFEDGVKLAGLLHEKILEIFNTILHWNGFHGSNNEDLLDAVLSCLSAQSSQGSDTCDPTTVKSAIDYLTSMRTTCPSSTSAKLIIQLLLKCRKLNDDNNHNNLNSACKEFLCRDWLTSNGDKEKGSTFNSTIASWIQTYIQSSEDTISTIDGMLVGPIKQYLENNSSDDNLEWRTINKHTFPACYRSIFEELVSWLRTTLLHDQKTIDHGELLVKLNDAVKCFHMLISLVRVVDSKIVLGYALKNGKLFLELFVKHAMPILDKQLKRNKETVASLLKNLQQSTRNLNHFCGHLKTVRDSSLTSHVPPIKKLLEMFVFRVKTMLATNNCDEAFWLGNLKNRDIHGNEIHSQISQQQESDGDEEEETETVHSENNEDDDEVVPVEDEAKNKLREDDHADSYSTCY